MGNRGGLSLVWRSPDRPALPCGPPDRPALPMGHPIGLPCPWGHLIGLPCPRASGIPRHAAKTSL